MVSYDETIRHDRTQSVISDEVFINMKTLIISIL